MAAFPQEIIDLFVDFAPSKAELESLSLAHRSFLPRSRYHLFSTIRLLHMDSISSLIESHSSLDLNYRSSNVFNLAWKSDDGALPLPNYLALFRSAITQNPFIVSSVRTLTFSLSAGSMNPQTDQIPKDLPFTQLHSLQVCFKHGLGGARKEQKWRLPRIIHLIQMNPFLQHLAIDECKLETSSWDTLFINIALLKQLHTLVLRGAAITAKSPYTQPHGSFSLVATPLTTKPSLKRLYLVCNEPELERAAISISHYFTITQLDALVLQCHPHCELWGQRAVLMNCGSRLTSLTIGVDHHLRFTGIEAMVDDLAFVNLRHLQFMFIRASELDVIGDWLLKKCIPLHLLHLSACEDHYRIEGDEIRAIDSILLNLVISMPSLQLITAHLTWKMFETLDSTKDLEAMLPQTFGTGKLKYGEMLKWWDLKSRFSDL